MILLRRRKSLEFHRGRAISRVVDVAEVSRHRFIMDARVKEIRIATEKINTERVESNIFNDGNSDVEVELLYRI